MNKSQVMTNKYKRSKVESDGSAWEAINIRNIVSLNDASKYEANLLKNTI